MEIRDCFRGGYGDHLKIIVSDPAKDFDNLLIVSVTTFREGKFHDPSCFLNPGDHPFIKHKSYVAFQHAKTRSNTDLNSLLGSGRHNFGGRSDFRVCFRTDSYRCCTVSEFIALEYVDLLREQAYID